MTNSLQLITKDPPKTIVKHLAAVHNSSVLTLTQRKISNIFLENALKTITEDKDHTITVKTLMEAIGWSGGSHVNDDLKENLKGLSRIQIEWNILEKDRKNKWVASTLLAHVAIKAGNVYYSYSRALRDLFSQPNVYARLNLDIQKDFSNKYSLILWEFIWGDLSSKKENKIETDWVVYATLLKLMGLVGSSYSKRFALFKERILYPALTEINEKADILVHFDEKKSGKKTTHMRFIGERKNNQTDEERKIKNSCEHLEQQLNIIGINARSIQKITQTYTEEEIVNALNYYKKYNEKNKIENPVAFFKKSLEEGWCIPSEDLKSANRVKTEVGREFSKRFIDSLEEDKDIKHIRTLLLHEVGEAEYKSWFMNTQFKITDNHLEISTSPFRKNAIESRFAQCLQIIISKSGCAIEFFKLTVEDNFSQA